MVITSVLWRRLDVPGHDACRLEQGEDGWSLNGAAAFQHEDGPAALAYRVSCDQAWRTRDGYVHGWVGARRVDLIVRRSVEGVWRVNGEAVAGLNELVDLDLGFTPATNLLQLRRIALAEGQSTAVPVAWLDVPAGRLEALHQRYERRSGATYWYEAPRFEYAALLEVDAAGFVKRYPELWQAER